METITTKQANIIFKNKKEKTKGQRLKIATPKIGRQHKVRGHVLRVFNLNKFLFIPENGIGCYDCRLLDDGEVDIGNIVEVVGGYTAINKREFFVESYKMDNDKKVAI